MRVKGRLTWSGSYLQGLHPIGIALLHGLFSFLRAVFAQTPGGVQAGGLLLV
jgi:hypothetical protein